MRCRGRVWGQRRGGAFWRLTACEEVSGPGPAASCRAQERSASGGPEEGGSWFLAGTGVEKILRKYSFKVYLELTFPRGGN